MPFRAPKVSETQKKSDRFVQKKIFPEILRGQIVRLVLFVFAFKKILLTLIPSQRERFNRYTDRQTDLFSKLQIGDPFLSLQNE